MLYSGYAGNIRKYYGDQQRNFDAAESAVNAALRGRASRNVEYINQLRRPNVVTLGDNADASSAGWMDVIKTFAGQVGSGVATRIAGGTKAPVTVIQPPSAPTLPTWAKVGLVVAGAGVVYLIVKRR